VNDNITFIDLSLKSKIILSFFLNSFYSYTIGEVGTVVLKVRTKLVKKFKTCCKQVRTGVLTLGFLFGLKP